MTETLADAVIVGGGILGMTLACELAKRTLRVALLESHAIGSGATGGGFAWINATTKDDDAGYHRLNADSMALYDAMAREWGAAQIGLHGGGSLQWANADDAAAREKLQGRADTLQRWNYPVAMLTGQEMRTLEPAVAFADDALGLFAPADGWLDTSRHLRFLAEEIGRRKGIVRQYSPATDFTLGITRSINRVHTIDGAISTPILILAAGLQIPALVAKITREPDAARCVPIHADAGLLIETQGDGQTRRGRETPFAPAPAALRRVLYPPDSEGLHLRPTSGGGLLFGADDSDRMAQAHLLALQAAGIGAQTMSGGDIPQEISAALYDRASRVSSALFPTGGAAQFLPRVCLRPMPADALPIVGSVPGVRGVFVLATRSGVTLAPALARALAEQICNACAPEELLPYHPQRFLES